MKLLKKKTLRVLFLRKVAYCYFFSIKIGRKTFYL